jgi:hypothetical protein
LIFYFIFFKDHLLIISHKKKFVYLRSTKTGSSSFEIYLSQYCSKKDVISPLFKDEEKLKKKYNLPISQNYILKKKSFGIKNFLNLNFYNKVHVHDHVSIDKILKSTIGHKIKDYFFFSFIRNPFDWIVSYFWWDLHFHKKKRINWINKVSQKELIEIFKKFLDQESKNFFDWQKNIVTSKNINIKIFKYENYNENIKKIRKKLNLNKEKEIVSIRNIRFKNLKINRKILIDKNEKKKIIEDGEFFFNNFYKNKTLPSKYKN